MRTVAPGRRRLVALFALAVAAATLSLIASLSSPATAGVRPPNDDFNRPITVELPISPLGTTAPAYENVQETAGATLETGEPQCLPDAGATVWYIFSTPVTVDLEVDTAGSTFATAVSVFRMTDFAPSPPGGSLEEMTCSAAPGGQASVSFTARPGSSYHIQLGGIGGATGSLRLRVSCTASCPPPNDDIGTAAPLLDLPYRDTIDTSGAALEDGEPRPCGGIGRTAWYRLETFDPAPGGLRLTASSGAFQPVLAVYEADYSVSPSPPGSLVLLQCREQADVTFSPKSSTLYYVQIGGTDGAGGVVTFDVTCAQEPCAFYPIEEPDSGVETGGPGTGGGGVIAGPAAGNGGYLPPPGR